MFFFEYKCQFRLESPNLLCGLVGLGAGLAHLSQRFKPHKVVLFYSSSNVSIYCKSFMVPTMVRISSLSDILATMQRTGGFLLRSIRPKTVLS